ncbi:hypothetical protein [Methylobacter sp. sgz302048]|uniref:hypothetical protein n=1 Tax=Methylobacter sp. sgz302048 TaxID=3455945 RepID=UPI003F9F16A9
MKYKYLAFICAIAAVSLPAINITQAETTAPVEGHDKAVKEAAETAVAADEGKALDMFRFSLRMEKLDFIKKAMKLPPEQEEKFLGQYDRYDTELKQLNDKRLAVIKDYADKIDNIKGAEADKLVKRMFDFRKKRTALLEKYYGKIAKATSKTVAARFVQIENILQATSDVKIGSTLPLMPQ